MQCSLHLGLAHYLQMSLFNSLLLLGNPELQALTLSKPWLDIILPLREPLSLNSYSHFRRKDPCYRLGI